ncbi:MAG: histidine kinase [Bacillota bacterium]
MNEEVRQQIESIFNLKIINEQNFPWGELYWLQLDPDNDKPQRTLSVATFYPDQEQKEHTHLGFEEIIYGLEGETVHWCDSRRIVLGKGQLCYVRGGGRHSIKNLSGRQARFLSIVYPTIPPALTDFSSIEDVELDELVKIINLDPIAEKFAQSVGLAVTLVDNLGNLLTEPKNIPEFCKLCLQEQCGNCVMSREAPVCAGNEPVVFHCKFGVASIQSPIVINKRSLGYLGCGYGRMSAPTPGEESLVVSCFSPASGLLAQKAYINLDLIRRNHLVSVAETLSMVSASLVQLMIHSAREKQINSYKLRLSQEKHRQAQLESSLNEVKLKLLESQVNPHFLFNTLNTIAQTAMMEGAATAASLTYSLSNLLRRSLGKTESLITVEEEMDYIKDYIFIQKTRFPSRFNFDTRVSPEIANIKVPCMTMMALVENSILHGFANIRWQGELEINVYTDGDWAYLEVVDNGSGISDEIIEDIKSLGDPGLSPVQLKGIGLRSVFKRLEYFYGGSFKFNMERMPKGGTRVTIRLPLNKE